MNKYHSLSRLLHGAATTFFFSLLGYVAMFFFRVVFARHYGPNDLGLYAFIETALGISTVLAAFGIQRGIPRDVPFMRKRHPALLRGYIRFVFLGPLVLACVLAVLLYMNAAAVAAYFSQPAIMVTFLRILAIALPLRQINTTVRLIYIAEDRVFNQQFSDIVIEKAVLLAGILACTLLHLPLIVQVCVLVFSIVCSSLYDASVYLFKIRYPMGGKVAYEIRSWLTFSVPLFLSGFFIYIINWSGNLIVGKYFTPTQLGIYSLVFSLAFFLNFFQASIATLFLPIISEDYVKNRGKRIEFLFRKSAAWVLITTLPAYLVFVLYGRQILSLIYGSQFSIGYSSLVVIGLGVLVAGVMGYAQQILLLHGKTVAILIVGGAAAGLSILGNILLIPLFGITGVALSAGISIGLYGLVLYFLAKRYQKLSLDYGFSMKFVLAGVLPALAGLVPMLFSIPVYVAVGLGFLLYLSLYVLILRLTRIFTREDREFLSALEKRLHLRLGALKAFCAE